MYRRSPIAVAITAVAVAGMALAIWPFPTQPGPSASRAAGITFARYERIQTGMSEVEVNLILGSPPGDYRSEPGFILVGPGNIPRDARSVGGKLAVWYIPGLHVEVLYDWNGRVAGKYWHDDESNR